MELSKSTWLVTSLSPGAGERMSKHVVHAGDVAGLMERFAQLREKARVRTGHEFGFIVIQEAGLDGFWIHRVLEREGIESYVVDPASIATSRRRRRAKTDKIDGEALVRAQLAYKRGEPRVCAMVRPPSVEEEDHRQRSVPGEEGLPPQAAGRAVREYLEVLDDAAFGGATPVTPKRINLTDPASRWTAATREAAFYSYSTNYLIDLENAVIVDVEATTSVRQAEGTAQRRMIERTQERFGFRPERLVADAAYGSAPNLAWLVEDRSIEPHIPVFDKSARNDGSFERADFIYDQEDDSYICPSGNRLRRSNRNFSTPRTGIDKDGSIRYRARQQDCQGCTFRQRCTPNMPARKVTRSIHEGARDVARNIATTDAYLVSRRQRKKVEMLFAHLKRILKLDRLRLRGPNGARDEFLLAATAQNLRKMAKMTPTRRLALA